MPSPRDPRYRTLDIDYFSPPCDSEDFWILRKDQQDSFIQARFLPTRGPLPADIDPESIRCVHIWGLTSKGVPEYLKELRSLRCLFVAPEVVPFLTTECLPSTLEMLEIIGPADKVKLPSSLFLPHLRALGAYAQIRFSPDSFPALQALSTRVDPKGTLLRQAASLSRLEALSYGSYRNADLRLFAACPLQWITISQGLNKSLEGAQVLSGMRGMRLIRMTGIESLEPLEALTNLEQLYFGTSRRLPSLAPLANLPKLRTLIFRNCGDLDWGGKRDYLASKLELLDSGDEGHGA
jgi:hypothetical protein